MASLPSNNTPNLYFTCDEGVGLGQGKKYSILYADYCCSASPRASEVGVALVCSC